jgi:hypothetical protein
MARQIVGRTGDAVKFVYTFDTICEPIWASGLGINTGRKQSISAVDAISHVSARGGTELDSALQRVHADLNGQIDDLILITDALVSQSECGNLVRSARQLTESGIAVHIIVVGSAPGRFIGDALSNAGGGLYLEQTGATYDKQELDDSVTRFLQGGCTLLGVGIDGQTHQCHHPVRGRPVMVAISATERPTNISVAIDGEPNISVPVSDAPEARFIWAREIVMGTIRSAWSKGESIDDHKAEIEKIGVDHQILTPFTSMVGLDPSETHDRTDVQGVVAQASLPVGMDPSSFFAMSAGGSLGMNAAGGLRMASVNYLASGGPVMARATKGMSMGDVDDMSFYSPAHTGDTWDKLCGKQTGDQNFDSSVENMQLETIGDNSGTYIGAIPSAVSSPSNDAGDRAATLLALILEHASETDPLANIDLTGFGLVAIVSANQALISAGLSALAGQLMKGALAHAMYGPVNITHTADQIDDLVRQIAEAMAKR